MKEEIYKYLKTLPKNKVTTYKNIGLKFNIHPRAVSVYMRFGNDASVPFYKVINSNWSVKWFQWLELENRIAKLKKDWIEVIGRKVPKKYII